MWVQNDEIVVKTKRIRHRPNKVHFFMVYRTNWMDLILKNKLNITEVGMLGSLMTFIDWQSNFLVHPKTKMLLNESTLADLLNCSRGCIRRHITTLNEKGLVAIVKAGSGSPNKYILNSNIAFYGRKIKDINEHLIFNDVEYVPKTEIKYEEAVNKD